MYEPQFEGIIQGYIRNQIDSNFWRFQPIYTFEDLEQECYTTFLKCKLWYNTKCIEDKKSAKVFMGYFKRAIYNCFVDLSKDATRHRTSPIELITPDEIVGNESESIVWFELIQDAPKEVGDVLSIILSAPKELFEVLGFREPRSRWSSSRFCEILGTKHDNMLTKVKKYLFENIDIEVNES